MMERLTQINGNNEVYCIVDDKKIVVENIDMLKICQRLKLYEDLDEQGLLLRLPCAVGSTVYVISSRYTKCSKYKEIWNDCYGCEDECDSHEEYYIHINHSVSDEWIVRYMNDFGKTVFLTKAEAEQKLKEMECD